jgi:four helix bundle protein
MKSQQPNPNEEPGKKDKPYDLGQRTLIFGRRILDICAMLPEKPECQRIRGQLGGAGTSVGANYQEGDGSLTKAERRKSFSVARKEARECKFFLQVISGKYVDESEVAGDIQEAGELVKIFSAIIDKLS